MIPITITITKIQIQIKLYLKNKVIKYKLLNILILSRILIRIKSMQKIRRSRNRSKFNKLKPIKFNNKYRYKLEVISNLNLWLRFDKYRKKNIGKIHLSLKLILMYTIPNLPIQILQIQQKIRNKNKNNHLNYKSEERRRYITKFHMQ